MPLAADDRLFLRLALTRGVGSRTAHKLLREFGEVGAIFDSSEANLSAVVGDKIAHSLKKESAETAAQIEATLSWLDQSDHHLLTWAHPMYPKALLESGDAPVVLYANGKLATLTKRAIAMVGSRNCSQGGSDTAEQFAEAFANVGVAIVSGLALGIDAAAHTGALRAKQADVTIAVVGTGIDRVYPARNKSLAHAIAERGLIISEYPLGTAPLAENFPRRNRIISGLSLGVLVVEASMQSGSLITARLAAEQGRDVFAIPGSIHSTFHKGCHYLIKQGAKLVESAQDVLEELKLETVADSIPAVSNGKPDNEEDIDSSALLQFLEHMPIEVDRLVERSGWSIDRVSVALTLLELSGRVEALPGGLWTRRG